MIVDSILYFDIFETKRFTCVEAVDALDKCELYSNEGACFRC